MKLKVYVKINRIFWETDGFSYKSCGIPATLNGNYVIWNVEGENQDQCDEAAFDLTSDWLSDTYCYCHRGYQGKVIRRDPLPDDAEIDN